MDPGGSCVMCQPTSGQGQILKSRIWPWLEGCVAKAGAYPLVRKARSPMKLAA